MCANQSGVGGNVSKYKPSASNVKGASQLVSEQAKSKTTHQVVPETKIDEKENVSVLEGSEAKQKKSISSKKDVSLCCCGY